MRNPVRKLMSVAVVGVLGALFAMPMLAAGAQEGPAPVAPQCTILSVTPNPVTAFPAEVTVTGTVESGVTVTLYGNGAPLASQVVTDNTFTLTANLVAATNLTVNFTFGNQNGYTGGCSTVGGEVVVRVDVKAAEVVKPAAKALAFTGSNDTPSYVLVGVAALVLGAVFVIAARRRSQVS